MKRDEVRKLIEGITDEQLDALMNLNGADIEAANRKTSSIQEKLDAANSELDGFRQTQKSQQTESERLQAALDDLAKQKREMLIKSNRIDARAVLKNIGLSDEVVNSQLDMLVTEDGESTLKNVQALADLITAQREEAAAAKEKDLLMDMNKPQGATSKSEPTKDDFSKMSYLDKLNLKSENPDLFTKLNS